MTDTRWKAQAERSTPFMLRLILGFAQHLGRRVTRVILYPVTLYFLLANRAATRASRQFLARAMNRTPGVLDLARHIHSFASVVLDRAFFVLNRTEDLRIDHHRAADEQRGTYAPGRGSLLFVSHLGSFEALRMTSASRLPFKVLLDREHGRMLSHLLESVNPGLAPGIIDTSQAGPGLALEVKQALDENYRVGVMVDRARAGEKTATVDFFGHPAPFPMGPWQLAAALKARVVLAFCLYRGGNRYDAHFELFSEQLIIPRAMRDAELKDCVRRYAQRLEHYAKLAPYNWFNFYNFWAKPDETPQH